MESIITATAVPMPTMMIGSSIFETFPIKASIFSL